jgi:hypothetical protein
VTTSAAASDLPCIPRELVDEYERLRGVATGSHDRSGLVGLGIFVRQGMAAWMRACAVAPPLPPPRVPELTAQLAPDVQRDVVDVLAAMVLTIALEVTA